MKDVVSDVLQSTSDNWGDDDDYKRETLKVNDTDVDIIISTCSAHLQGSRSSTAAGSHANQEAHLGYLTACKII